MILIGWDGIERLGFEKSTFKVRSFPFVRFEVHYAAKNENFNLNIKL